MRPRPFEYYSPKTLDEALRILEEKEDAKVLAGGQSLLALMKLRILSPPVIIDLNRVDGLRYIREEPNGWVAIGAMTLHDEVEQSPVIRRRYPILAESVYKLGDQQVRNRGTIGGSIAHADPSANLPPVMVALRAEFVAVSRKGRRVIPAEDFFVDAFTTALDEKEILTEIRLPPWEGRSGGAYTKLSRREIDFAIVEAAVQLRLDDRSRVSDIRVVLGAVGPKPYRAVETEKLLLGREYDEELIARASEEGTKDLDPPSDVQASSWYRKEVAPVVTKRTIIKAWRRALGT